MSPRPRSRSQARLSVVVPVYNEQAVLPDLFRRLRSTLGPPIGDFEVILVDDGSSDESPALLDEMHDADPRFCCLHLSRNFGHQAAVTAGLHHARGDVTCVMDADLQDPPELLARFLDEWEKGSDVVYGVRRNRKERRVKVRLYDLFYRILNRLAVIPMPLDAGDFCLLSREALDEMNRLPERERFVRGLRAWVGFHQTGVEYDRAAREHGESKYSIFGLARLAMTGIVSFSDKPLIYLTVFGVSISLVAFLYGAYLLARRLFFGGILTGYASMMSGLLFLSGLQLISIGVVGIYVSKIFQEVKARPTYIVASRRGFEPPRRQQEAGAS